MDRVNQILHALSRDGEGVQITMMPDGRCTLDLGYPPYNRFVGPDLATVTKEAARKMFQVAYTDTAVWRELVMVDANGYFI